MPVVRKQQLMAFVIFAGALAAAPAHAGVIFSNFSSGPKPFNDGNGLVINNTNAIAASFQVGNTAQLTSVDLPLDNENIGGLNLNVFLASSNGNLPGTILEQLVQQGPILLDKIVTFTSTTSPTLTAGNTYWIVTTFANGRVVWDYNNTGSIGGAINQTNSSSTGPWSRFNAQATPAFQVNGDPVTAVPEPTSLALFAAAIPGMAWAAYRRTRRHAMAAARR